VRIVVPVPACVSEPVPDMTPASVTLLLRLMNSAALSTMDPAMLPLVRCCRACNVPAEIVVLPL